MTRLEAEGHAEPREPGLENLGRVVPRAAVRLDVVVLRLKLRRLIAVQQIPEVHADIGAHGTEPHDLREPHVHLIAARTVQPVVGIEQRYRRRA